MDFTGLGMTVSLLSMSVAVLKMSFNGHAKRVNHSEDEQHTNHSSTETSRRIDAVQLQKDLSERPTFKDADNRYMNSQLCGQVHKEVAEKLSCLPEIEKSLIEIKVKLEIEDELK